MLVGPEDVPGENVLALIVDDQPVLAIDRLDVAPDGRMRVVDYKTGRAPGAMWEAKALFQMKFYALVLWRTRGVVPAMLQLVYLGSGEILRYAPEEATFRDAARVAQIAAATQRAQAVSRKSR